MDWSVHPVHLVVEAACIAHDAAALPDPPPERGGPGPAVGAHRVPALLQVTALPLALLHQRPVAAVHLVVEAAGVAEVVAGGVSPPQRSV